MTHMIPVAGTEVTDTGAGEPELNFADSLYPATAGLFPGSLGIEPRSPISCLSANSDETYNGDLLQQP
jgi:hypothetical protein